MKFTLPKLDYDYDALEPSIDAETMKIHYTKHHQGYVDKLNAAIEKEGIEVLDIESLLKNVSTRSTAIRNNGGGHYNHSLFWKILSPDGGNKPSGELMDALKEVFKSFDGFKEAFESAAGSRFGSGWAWLIVANEGKLKISSTPNQDSPIMDDVENPGIPLLGLDVWEHAYYLKYQNKRPDYIKAFWNLVDWDVVEDRYKKATSDKTVSV